ncbi:hypothetical protein GWK47_034384 [Chionoecetes opilio]|uniref:Uncharacterized protein n=1 Tax=Chionoecetes opilio TaxID=41210 RepID=A0A8J4YGG4_CHIOP|nr:hypothetical protein GWK47_034384 [Chionoecetes opilio]
MLPYENDVMMSDPRIVTLPYENDVMMSDLSGDGESSHNWVYEHCVTRVDGIPGEWVYANEVPMLDVSGGGKSDGCEALNYKQEEQAYSRAKRPRIYLSSQQSDVRQWRRQSAHQHFKAELRQFAVVQQRQITAQTKYARRHPATNEKRSGGQAACKHSGKPAPPVCKPPRPRRLRFRLDGRASTRLKHGHVCKQWQAASRTRTNDQERFQKYVAGHGGKARLHPSGDTRSTLLEQKKEKKARLRQRKVFQKSKSGRVPPVGVQTCTRGALRVFQMDLNKLVPQTKELQNITPRWGAGAPTSAAAKCRTTGRGPRGGVARHPGTMATTATTTCVVFDDWKPGYERALQYTGSKNGAFNSEQTELFLLAQPLEPLSQIVLPTGGRGSAADSSVMDRIARTIVKAVIDESSEFGNGPIFLLSRCDQS